MNTKDSRSTFITILTKPPVSGDNFLGGFIARSRTELRLFANSMKSGMRHKTIPRKNWGGHPAVTESLICGLRAERIPFSVNPMTINSESSAVLGILGGMETFSWALAQNESARQLKFLVGPNVFETPLDVGRDCLNPAIVGLVTPSNWVRDFYASELPEFDRPIHVWAAGVDSNFWTPGQKERVALGATVLLYAKTKNRQAVESAKLACETAGFQVTIVTYGGYSRTQYLRALREASVMVVVGGTESQGLALFEAWSVGVPTLVFRHDGSMRLRSRPGKEIVIGDPANAAPYLSSETGFFWGNSAELIEILRGRDLEECRSRNWILGNATMAISARKYAEIYQEISRT